MRSLLALFFAAALSGQTATMSLSGPTNLKAGSSGTFNLSIASGGGEAAFQFSLQVSAADVANVTAAASANLSSAGKSLQCGPYTAGVLTCLVYGINTTAITDGAEVTLAIQIARTAGAHNSTLAIANALEASAAGAGIALTAGPTLSISILSLCDVDGNGIVNAADATAEGTYVLTGAAASVCDLNGDGVCNIEDVQIVAVAASGGACAAK